MVLIDKYFQTGVTISRMLLLAKTRGFRRRQNHSFQLSLQNGVKRLRPKAQKVSYTQREQQVGMIVEG
jgi:hypothetical protein